MIRFIAFFAAAVHGLATFPAIAGDPLARPIPVNVIDGTDERGSITERGPALGLTPAEIARIRKVSGHVVCADGGQPVTASGALYLTNDQVLTAAHVFFDAAGRRKSQCFFRRQAAGSEWVPLKVDTANARFGANPPRPNSNNDWAIVRLGESLADAEPFPVDPSRPAAGDALVVVSAQPAGFEHLDPAVPVVQGCTVRRAPVSSEATSFYRTDCDASSGSSGGMHLFRLDGALVFRGMTISTGPTRDPAFHGAPYDEQGGSVTTALGTDAAILAAGESLASGD
jgi:hypothetical protein